MTHLKRLIPYESYAMTDLYESRVKMFLMKFAMKNMAALIIRLILSAWRGPCLKIRKILAFI